MRPSRGIAATKKRICLRLIRNDQLVLSIVAITIGVGGGPISTFLIIFELNGNFGLTVAVMLSITVSWLIVRQMVGHSLFT